MQFKIILIANYLPDKQESMERFMQMLYKGCNEKNIDVTVWRPVVFFAMFSKNTLVGLGKLLGYVDKLIVSPLSLVSKTFLGKNVIYHVCDHSNAPYINFLPKSRTVITCHDVLAIRGALGYKDAYCEASKTGKTYQRWILNSLLKANKIAFVSDFTLHQFIELRGQSKSMVNKNSSYEVIYNGFNANFLPLNKNDSQLIFNNNVVCFSTPYILAVGSSLPRKNRRLLIEMLNCLKDSWNGIVCFAGQKIDNELQSIITKYRLEGRVVSITKPNHDLLLALYSQCEAFIFPSFSEGFGWPLIEAQACGVPVITSNLQPMIEVCGGGAIHVNPNNKQDFAKAFLTLQDRNTRNGLVEKGFKNCERFETSKMIDGYLAFYEA